MFFLKVRKTSIFNDTTMIEHGFSVPEIDKNNALSCRQEYFYVTQPAGNGLQRFVVELVAGPYPPVVSRGRILACNPKKGLHSELRNRHGDLGFTKHFPF